MRFEFIWKPGSLAGLAGERVWFVLIGTLELLSRVFLLVLAPRRLEKSLLAAMVLILLRL